jgi:hypothetical protein
MAEVVLSHVLSAWEFSRKDTDREGLPIIGRLEDYSSLTNLRNCSPRTLFFKSLVQSALQMGYFLS